MAAVILLVSQNLILRETRLGSLAKTIDALPSPIQSTVFLYIWLLFFTGWTVPIYVAVRNLSGNNKPHGKGPTTNDQRPTTPS